MAQKVKELVAQAWQPDVHPLNPGVVDPAIAADQPTESPRLKPSGDVEENSPQRECRIGSAALLEEVCNFEVSQRLKPRPVVQTSCCL